MKIILITGCFGLIGAECVTYFCNLGYKVVGIDNDYRGKFFGPEGSVSSKGAILSKNKNFTYYNIDLRDREKLEDIFKKHKFDSIIHAAAQPSHDLAARIPLEDFEVNALVTVLLLDYARNYCKDAPFVFFSTNKVTGDNPNRIKLKELETRYDFDDSKFLNGIDETLSIDNCLHSLYGAGKLAADVYCQEFGRYYGMFTCCLRAGCLTGPNHMGIELHGFLDYLIKCNCIEREYNIFGYKGKMVRDNIHSYDIVSFCNEFINNPRKGEVYTIGGGKENSISILEAITKIENISGIKMKTRYIESPRVGDHMVYYSDMTKLKSHYPNWKLTKNLDDIFKEIYDKYKKV